MLDNVPRIGKIIIAGFALVFAIFIVLELFLSTPTKSWDMGEEAVISVTGKQGALAAIDEDTWKEMVKSSAAKDDVANAYRMQAGTLFDIPNGTRVRIIDYGSAYGSRLYKVRVLTGEKLNRAGFVDGQFLK